MVFSVTAIGTISMSTTRYCRENKNQSDLKMTGTVNIPTQLGDGSGKRPLPNPDVNRPVVMMRNKTAGENETTAPIRAKS